MNESCARLLASFCPRASVSRHTFGRSQWKSHEERCALANLTGKVDATSMLVHHDPTRDREPLAGPATHLLGGEERIENSIADFGRNPSTVVRYCHDDLAALDVAPNGYEAAATRVEPLRLDGVCRVDDEVEEYLIQLSEVA